MSTKDQWDQRTKVPDPMAKPDVPEFAERMTILEHVRHQFQPILLNAAGGPDIFGPRDYLGLELRCPMCKHIQPLVPPGTEGTCAKCQLKYKYTAAKGNSWLWIWRQQPKLNLDGPRPLLDIPVGGAVEVQRSFQPGVKKNPNHSNNSQSGFIVNTSARKKDE